MHKKWTTWVAVILMLVAIVAYFSTMDEELAPESDGQRMPAAAE